MIYINDEEFYEVLGPESVKQDPEKNPKIQRNIKAILVGIAALILFIIGLIAAIKYIAQTSQNKKAVNEERNVLIARIEDKIAKCGDDEKDYCRNKYWNDAAIEKNEPDFCSFMTDDKWRSSCIKQIAMNMSDVKVCNELSVDKNECKDAVYLQQISENYDFSICDNIKDETNKESCINYIAKKLAEEGECPDSGIGSGECANYLKLENAIQDGDCLRFSVSSPEYEACMDTLSDADTDGDGISDLDEIKKYNTDPRNKDTDGDGYEDGIEIRYGFDPLQ